MADRKGVEIPHGWAVDSKGLVRRLIIQISEAKPPVNIFYIYLRYFKLEFELDEIFSSFKWNFYGNFCKVMLQSLPKLLVTVIGFFRLTMRLFDLKMTLYDILNYSCIFICSYLWSFGGKMHIWCHHKQYFALLSYKANWFHVAMGLFSNERSQKTSKCVRTLVTHSAVPFVLFFFFSDHILTSSVVCYWTHAWQHGIYLFSTW